MSNHWTFCLDVLSEFLSNLLFVVKGENTGIIVKQCMVIQGWTFPSMGFEFENRVDILNVDFGSVSILDSGDGAGQRL